MKKIYKRRIIFIVEKVVEQIEDYYDKNKWKVIKKLLIWERWFTIIKTYYYEDWYV